MEERQGFYCFRFYNFYPKVFILLKMSAENNQYELVIFFDLCLTIFLKYEEKTNNMIFFIEIICVMIVVLCQ